MKGSSNWEGGVPSTERCCNLRVFFFFSSYSQLSIQTTAPSAGCAADYTVVLSEVYVTCPFIHLHPTQTLKAWHIIVSLFCFLFLECFTSITWQRAKTVQMRYRTEHRLLQTSFSQATCLIFTTFYTLIQPTYLYSPAPHTLHCTQTSPWTLKAHTHTLFECLTQHVNVQSLNQQ